MTTTVTMPDTCKTCGGSGGVPIGEHYITPDMAMDGGTPELAGASMGVEWGPCPDCDGKGRAMPDKCPRCGESVVLEANEYGRLVLWACGTVTDGGSPTTDGPDCLRRQNAALRERLDATLRRLRPARQMLPSLPPGAMTTGRYDMALSHIDEAIRVLNGGGR